jgi:hypothetical protein
VDLVENITSVVAMVGEGFDVMLFVPVPLGRSMPQYSSTCYLILCLDQLRPGVTLSAICELFWGGGLCPRGDVL